MKNTNVNAKTQRRKGAKKDMKLKKQETRETNG
jgi:hypothetical protein